MGSQGTTPRTVAALYRKFLISSSDYFGHDDIRMFKACLKELQGAGLSTPNIYGENETVRKIELALLLIDELHLDKSTVSAAILYNASVAGEGGAAILKRYFSEEVAQIVESLSRVEQLYKKTPVIETENFRNLLLTFAHDIRVVLILLADRLSLMRALNDCSDEEMRRKVAYEASYLYAPLAHRLGVYKIKTELEDLSLKYTNREIYAQIAQRLKSKKSERKAYIDAFIEPIREKLEASRLDFEVKGRPKSIHSIWNKIRKQEVSIDHIYDLFAIRIILDTPPEKEKSTCWFVYSLVTDMYQPNPKRLRDWLSVPKSNGYESLHTTVLGPDNKWVEVQIRTRRMDEIAERGLAAHWKYKGGRENAGMEKFIASVREMLEENEAASTVDLIREFRVEMDTEEIYVFTPKGDLHQLSKNATVLDFAFHIHSNLGAKCVGALVNGRNATLRQSLHSGDQVEILTSNAQTPKRDWLQIVTTSKAKAKIRQALKEEAHKEAQFGKEIFDRRIRNRKIEINEALLTQLQKKSGYKTATDFFAAIGTDKLEVNHVIDLYQELERKDKELKEPSEPRSAENFVLHSPVELAEKRSDVLVLDKGVSGIGYKLAKCCNPLFGDSVFAFVSINGAKIHRTDCPNAPEMISRFGYRIKEVRWAGRAQSYSECSIRVIGNDDFGILSNIKSLLSGEKEEVLFRSINISSHDGLFDGTLFLSLKDSTALESIIKKIATVKGVKKVFRG